MPGAQITLDGRGIQTTVVSPTQLTGIVPPGLPPGPYAISVVNPGLPAAPPLMGQFNIQNPGTLLYVPVAIKRSADDSTAMFIQNIAPGVANIVVQFYDLNGFSDPRWTSQPANVPTGQSLVLDLASYPPLPMGFSGSAVVQSSQPVTAVVNRTVYSGSRDLALDTDADVQAAQSQATGARASGGSFPVAAGPGTPQMTVPVTFGGYNGYFTTISVQNTTRQPATYTITLFPTGAPAPIASIQRLVPPQSSVRVRLGPESGAPPDFVGTAIVAGQGGATMVVAAETIQRDTGVLLSYAGFATGTNVMNAPLLFKNYNGWVSGAQVVNVSSGPIRVNAQLFQRDNPFSVNLPPRDLGPNESFTYYLPAIPPIQDGFVGSGVFTANGPIAVVVQELNAERGTGMAYSAFGPGSPNVSIPVIFKGSAGWDTGVQVQNLAPTDATVNIQYYLPGGGIGAVDAARIPAGGSTTFYQPDQSAIPPNTIGSALISSLGGEPIVAIVNEVNYTHQGDASMAYEGINFAP
jgi:hypothetical protein